MTDFKRLVSLIFAAEQHCKNTACFGCDVKFDMRGFVSNSIGWRDCPKFYIADYLLKNGVSVPPCNVGDFVYIISRNEIKKCDVVFIGLSADEKCSYFNFVEYYADGKFKQEYSMVFAEIGKTVFLTREEAEKFLKERETE